MPVPPETAPETLPHTRRSARGKWVGSGRVTLRHVSPIPPLDPYVRLSPHTAHERGILQEMSISPAPRSIRRGQLCAFAGYLCTLSLPSPSGPLPCAQLSCAPTTMPHLTACRASEFRMGLPMPTLHPPSHPWQALPCSPQRTQTRRGRWRVLCLSLPLSAAPQSEAG